MIHENRLIFFVDDDKLILNLLEYTFNNRAGYQVKSFTNGEDCLKNLGMEPKVVVIDHLFTRREGQGLTGLDVLDKIKTQNHSVNVVVLSNQDEPSLIKEYMAKGAYRYIQKNDYFIDELISTLDSVFTSIPKK